MNLLSEYIKYRWKAKGRHGIHSPFIYKMIDECFKISIEKKDKKIIKSFINSEKKIKTGRCLLQFSSKKKYQFFYRINSFYQAKNVLIIGTSSKINILYLALGNKNATIFLLEENKLQFEQTHHVFKEKNINNINTFNCDLRTFLQQNSNIFDLIVCNNLNNQEHLLSQIEKLKPLIHDDTLIVINNIRSNKQFLELWQKIISDQFFNVTIDFFQMGMIAKRSGQRKEHFILKK